MGDQFLSLLSFVADQERMKILDRQTEGIEGAKIRGVVFGREKINMPLEFENEYRQWKHGEITAVTCMKNLNLKKITFYERVKEYEVSDKKMIMILSHDSGSSRKLGAIAFLFYIM